MPSIATSIREQPPKRQAPLDDLVDNLTQRGRHERPLAPIGYHWFIIELTFINQSPYYRHKVLNRQGRHHHNHSPP